MSDKQPGRQDPLRGRRPASERIPQRRDTDDTTQVTVPTEAQQRPDPPKPKRKREPLSVPWWGFLLMIVLVGGATCGLWAYVLSLRNDPSVAELGPSPTPIFVVITATPTLDTGVGGSSATPTPTLGGGLQPTSPALPATSTSPPENREITVGSTVTITGTGDLGLSIRQGPGTNYGIFAIGQDGDTFTVEDGPREANGFTWWYIVDPNDEDRAGWAVQQFMAPSP